MGVALRPRLGNVHLHTHGNAVDVQLVNVGGDGHGVQVVEHHCGLPRLPGALPFPDIDHDDLPRQLGGHRIVGALFLRLRDLLLELDNLFLSLGDLLVHRLHLLLVVGPVELDEDGPGAHLLIVHRPDAGHLAAHLGGEILAAAVLQLPLHRRIELFARVRHQIAGARHSLGEGARIVQGDGDGKAVGALRRHPVHHLNVGDGPLLVEHEAGHGHPGLHAHVDLILIGVAEILGQAHLAVVHKGGQLGSGGHIVPHVHGHIGDPAGKGGCHSEGGDLLLELGELFLVIVQLVFLLGDLILILLNLVVQL